MVLRRGGGYLPDIFLCDLLFFGIYVRHTTMASLLGHASTMHRPNQTSAPSSNSPKKWRNESKWKEWEEKNMGLRASFFFFLSFFDPYAITYEVIRQCFVTVLSTPRMLYWQKLNNERLLEWFSLQALILIFTQIFRMLSSGKTTW